MLEFILSTIINTLIAHPTLPLWALILSFVFWVLFASAATLYYKRLKYDKGDWQWWALSIPGYPLALVTFIYDIIFEHTVANLLFWSFPRIRKQGKGFSRWEWTLTSRMKRLVQQKKGWRTALAKFICKKMVEPWDPNHCGLARRTGVFVS